MLPPTKVGGFQAFQHQKNWWLLIVVAIVVAVIASVITAGITGNVIKLNQDRFGKNLVYTKAEVDNMMKNVENNIINSLNNVSVIELDDLDGTCSEICKKQEPAKTCIMGGFLQVDENPGKYDWRLHHIFSCNQQKGFSGPNNNVFCICK